MKCLTALLLLICSGAACADEASHRRLAEELMGLTQTEATVRNWRKNFDTQAQDVVNTATRGRRLDQLSEAQARSVRHFNERGAAVLNEALAWNRLQEPLERLYMQTFNEAETRDLIAFYKSPLGQKMLTGLPALSEGVANVVRSQIDTVRPQLQSISVDFQNEYSQAGTAAPTALAPSPKPLAPPAKPVAPVKPAFVAVTPAAPENPRPHGKVALSKTPEGKHAAGKPTSRKAPAKAVATRAVTRNTVKPAAKSIKPKHGATKVVGHTPTAVAHPRCRPGAKASQRCTK
jgi:uncharacterized protein